jgi:hypothetical protein
MSAHFTDESLSWRKLCRSAALEEDPDRLSQIVQKMNFALKIRQKALCARTQSARDITFHIAPRMKHLA